MVMRKILSAVTILSISGLLADAGAASPISFGSPQDSVHQLQRGQKSPKKSKKDKSKKSKSKAQEVLTSSDERPDDSVRLGEGEEPETSDGDGENGSENKSASKSVFEQFALPEKYRPTCAEALNEVNQSGNGILDFGGARDFRENGREAIISAVKMVIDTNSFGTHSPNTYFDVSNTGIDLTVLEEVIRQLIANNKILVMNLAGNENLGDGVIELLPFPCLASVNLSNTQVTDAGVARVITLVQEHGLGHLRHIILTGTLVTEEAVAELRATLERALNEAVAQAEAQAGDQEGRPVIRLKGDRGVTYRERLPQSDEEQANPESIQDGTTPDEVAVEPEPSTEPVSRTQDGLRRYWLSKGATAGRSGFSGASTRRRWSSGSAISGRQYQKDAGLSREYPQETTSPNRVQPQETAAPSLEQPREAVTLRQEQSRWTPDWAYGRSRSSGTRQSTGSQVTATPSLLDDIRKAGNRVMDAGKSAVSAGKNVLARAKMRFGGV
jgi:hypothetical protein